MGNWGNGNLPLAPGQTRALVSSISKTSSIADKCVFFALDATYCLTQMKQEKRGCLLELHFTRPWLMTQILEIGHL